MKKLLRCAYCNRVKKVPAKLYVPKVHYEWDKYCSRKCLEAAKERVA